MLHSLPEKWDFHTKLKGSDGFHNATWASDHVTLGLLGGLCWLVGRRFDSSSCTSSSPDIGRHHLARRCIECPCWLSASSSMSVWSYRSTQWSPSKYIVKYNILTLTKELPFRYVYVGFRDFPRIGMRSVIALPFPLVEAIYIRSLNKTAMVSFD